MIVTRASLQLVQLLTSSSPAIRPSSSAIRLLLSHRRGDHSHAVLAKAIGTNLTGVRSGGHSRASRTSTAAAWTRRHKSRASPSPVALLVLVKWHSGGGILHLGPALRERRELSGRVRLHVLLLGRGQAGLGTTPLGDVTLVVGLEILSELPAAALLLTVVRLGSV